MHICIYKESLVSLLFFFISTLSQSEWLLTPKGNFTTRINKNNNNWSVKVWGSVHTNLYTLIANIPLHMNKCNIQYFAVALIQYYLRVAANRKPTPNGMNEYWSPLISEWKRLHISLISTCWDSCLDGPMLQKLLLKMAAGKREFNVLFFLFSLCEGFLKWETPPFGSPQI